MTVFFSPGPGQLFKEVRGYITTALDQQIPSISHRSKRFEEISAKAVAGVRALLGVPASHQIFFLGSGTEAMERIVQNVVREHSFHFVNGAFSARFHEIASELGREAVAHNSKLGSGFDFEATKVPEEAELICVTQNETSTGVSTPEAQIHALARRYPNSLIAVDIVSSAPYPELDYSLVDCSFFSVQKCFGLPAGLGVLTVSPRAMARAKKLADAGHSIGSYHSFTSLEHYAKINQTPETPPVLEIYLLAEVTELMLQSGIAKIRGVTRERADILYGVLSQSKKLSPFITDTAIRSATVITVQCADGAAAVKKTLGKAGFEVGSGYGEFKESQIRIANFPAVEQRDFEGLISVLRGFDS